MHLQEQQPAHVSHRFFPSLCEHLVGKQTMGRIFIHNIMCTQRQGLECLFLGLCLLLSRRCSALQLWQWRERVTEPAVPSVEFESSVLGLSHMETPSRSPACSKMELQPPHSSYCTAHVLMFTLSVSSNWWGDPFRPLCYVMWTCHQKEAGIQGWLQPATTTLLTSHVDSVLPNWLSCTLVTKKSHINVVVRLARASVLYLRSTLFRFIFTV